MKKRQVLIAVVTAWVMGLGLLSMKFHNEIYIWWLGDVEGMISQAASQDHRLASSFLMKLEAKDSTLVNDIVLNLKLMAR